MAEPLRCLGFLRQDGSFPIILNQMNVLQFYLEVRSPRPGNMAPDEFVTCFATALEPYGFQDFEGAEEARKEHLYEWLLERVLTFRAEPRWVDKKRLYRAHDVRAYPFDLNKGDLWQYELVPAINPKLTDERVFEAMAKGLPLRGVYPAKSDLPAILAYEEKFFGPFPVVLPNASGCTVRPAAGGFGQIAAVADGLEVIDDETHWFVRRERYTELINELESRAALAASADLLAQRGRPVELVSETPRSAPTEPQPQGPGVAEGLSEAAFLDRLRRTAVAAGAYYRDEELLNLHTSLKASSFVVLAGPSGLGKSSLIEIYRQALGLTEGDNFLWLAVRPNWNDDADLIGYYDPLNRLYRPGEAGLVDLLLRAQARPDELFFVCFDEMNLAKVEHYFSQFLSNLERPAEYRYLRLYSPELAPEVLNGHRYPPQIRLGPNLLFAGTVNRDEAAHAFSDKVLSRANLIEMSHVNLSQWWQMLCGASSRTEVAAAQTNGQAEQGVPVTAHTWLSWQGPLQPETFQSEVRRLEAINNVLGEKGFGYRIARQILLYLQYVPGGGGARSQAFDAQVAQRIIAPLRGSREELQEVCGRLATVLEGCPASQRALQRKLRELELYAFTS